MDSMPTTSMFITLKNDIIHGCSPDLLRMLALCPADVMRQPLSAIFVNEESNSESKETWVSRLNRNSMVVMLKGNAGNPICAEMTLDTEFQKDDQLCTIYFTPVTGELLQSMRDDIRRHRVGTDVWNVGLFEHHHQDGTIFSSRRMREIYGFPTDREMDFGQFDTAVHPDDRDMEGVRKSHDPNGDGKYENRFRIVKPSGEIRWMHARAQTTFGNVNGERKPLFTTGTMFDITEQHLLKTALEENERKLADILNSLPSVVLGVNSQGGVTQWNKEAETLTGILESDALHRQVTDVFPMLGDHLDNIRKAQQEQISIECARIPWSHSERMSFYNIYITPLHNSNSADVVVRIDDITEQVRFEEMLVHSEKLLSVGGLAAGMAHEINNPLAAVLQNVQVIMNRLAPEHPINVRTAKKVDASLEKMTAYLEARNIPRMLDSIYDAGTRAATIVKNMLGFVRISGKQHLPCNLPELMETTLEMALNDYDLARKTDFRKIKIQRAYAGDVRTVNCDAGKIQQVLLNLIKNAGQALFEAQVSEPRIFIRIQPQKEMVKIEFEDNGPGIPENIARRVFEPFFTTKQVGAGTGLGLSISYFIVVQEHNGQIRVEKGQYGGARFVIELP
ncbi:MAG: PAS domain S-box protein [Deltaproteobacteria bacterium]|nr:PAS domain S-box protein [Deltaproteobacteria bacterium]